MLEPMRKPRKSVWEVLVDVLLFLALIATIVVVIRVCDTAEKVMKPGERSCLQQLKAATHKDTNFTEDELLSYGRCVLSQEE
jgi:hypothetical protein